MFQANDREKIRTDILKVAGKDSRLGGGAVTGSASIDREDKWSDIDLAFGVIDPHIMTDVLEDFSQTMYQQHGALHHFDVKSGNWVYRVFLLASTMQVDLAFVPHTEFGARSETFKLAFGSSSQIPHDPPPAVESLIGWGWLYALHVRSCIKRERFLQAEFMLSGMRDQLVALQSIRHQLNPRQYREADLLSDDIRQILEKGLVRTLQADEILRAFQVVTTAFLEEIRFHETKLSARLDAPLRELAQL